MTLGPRTAGTIVATLRDDGKVDAKLYLGSLKPAFEGKGYSDIGQVKLSFARFLLPGDSIEDVSVEWGKGGDMVDWENHRAKPVTCRVQIRQSYQGRPMREDMAAINGQFVSLIALWYMGDHEAYPGEWALGSASGGRELGPAHWIASGDVVPVQENGVADA